MTLPFLPTKSLPLRHSPESDYLSILMVPPPGTADTAKSGPPLSYLRRGFRWRIYLVAVLLGAGFGGI